MKCYYMHTISNYPAFFSASDGQICYSDKDHPVLLRKTLRQIRKDQRITIKNRTKWGFDKKGYSYERVRIK